MKEGRHQKKSERKEMNIKLTASLIVAILVLIFIIQNAEAVKVQFLFWSLTMSLALLILVLVLIGMLLSWLLSSYFAFKKSKKKKNEPV
jgi:uncharacterized integral membrane protein